MGQRDRETSNEVLLLANLCRHHEQTIAEMFNVQEPILRYARAMKFICDYPDFIECIWDEDPLEAIENEIDHWEHTYEKQYKPDWSVE